ncbi:hypothetical protein [Neisseria animaloris]|uniref:Uncharacterized protein n=1 Tax=Neisseria animaloris TaxID=326522 RepID=A0A448UDG6_9NEIS|nr:Uncharacterised protein [Neisseria animaloris]
MSYSQLTEDERSRIQYLFCNQALSEIVKQINCHKSVSATKSNGTVLIRQQQKWQIKQCKLTSVSLIIRKKRDWVKIPTNLYANTFPHKLIFATSAIMRLEGFKRS